MGIPGLLFNNPLSPSVVDRVVDRLDLSPEDTVLDVGCGNGEILARVLDRYGCRGVGVDSNGAEIEAARRRLSDHTERVVLHACDVNSLNLKGRKFGAAVCVGSTHAFGEPGEGYLNAIRFLRDFTGPGGCLLMGEGYWKREPEEEYLKATGMVRKEFVSHAGNVEVAESEGLTPLYAVTSDADDWDHFEGMFWHAAEENLRRNPGDEKAMSRARHWRNWRKAYLHWGRSTLGFGLYLFRVGAPAGPTGPR